jgi:hemerythrin-like domain-containing protein
MENEIFKLRKEHVNFKKLLSLFDAQLDFIFGGKSPDYQLMEDILYYMTQYTDIIHHPIEEVIFALLATRDTSVAENTAALTKQHQMIGESGAFLYEKLGNIINGHSEIRKLQEIEMLGRLYSSTLRAHMDKEEQSLFILAEQLLNDDDWKKIKSETQTKPDPIFGEAVEARFHLVCNQLAQSVSNK